MTCTKCNEPQRDGAKYCHKCGWGETRLAEALTTGRPGPDYSRAKPTNPVFVAVLMVAAFLLVCWLGVVAAEKGDTRAAARRERESAQVVERQKPALATTARGVFVERMNEMMVPDNPNYNPFSVEEVNYRKGIVDRRTGRSPVSRHPDYLRGYKDAMGSR